MAIRDKLRLMERVEKENNERIAAHAAAERKTA